MKSAFKTAWVFYSTAIVMLILVLFILPGEVILNNTPLCESISRYNIECFACGMTRGFVHIAHFEFYAASEVNRGSIYIFVIFVLNTLLFFKYLFNLKRSGKIIYLKRKQKWAKAV
ncbi:MAG TPA: DUF2752 domain-containing protein [Ignavibacteria bacterium]|nr:DUF2752 domain-containing protein [Ignavibacteria bacterium]